MKKILYISCLVSKKEKYDGERIKNTLVYNSLKKLSDVSLIDLTKHKLLNTFRILWNGLFKKNKYDYFIISKDPHGANIIQKILNFSKVDPNKIIYFEIGPFLYNRILEGSIKAETFKKDKLIVVETKSMKEELQSLGFERIDVFPNFKEIVDVPFKEQIYPKDVLKLVYLSRIEEKKGIYDLIDVLREANKNNVRFILDVYGRPQNKEDENRIFALDKELSFISYKGKIDMDKPESYSILSEYDLHVFPTKYPEGFPGTIIDFFIAGVPTLSSSFLRAKDILTDKDSIIYRQADNNNLLDNLNYIHSNQNTLVLLRKESFKRREQYSCKSFDLFLSSLINQP